MAAGPFVVPMADLTDNLDDGSALAELMRGLYQRLLEAAFDDAAASGIGVAWDLANPYVQDVLDALAEQIKGVAATTKDEIRALVARQAAEGWSLERLASELEQLAGVRSATRAAVIARTETARAYALGSLAAWQVSGEVAASEWLTAGDELECPICAPLNGQQADLGRPFDGGIYFPPAHPNCRCALLPVLT